MKKFLLILFSLNTIFIFSQIRQVKDIWPGTISSNVSNPIVYANKIFFVADDGTNGREVWLSDGTESGTLILKDIRTDLGFGSFPNSFTIANDLLFFSASDSNATQPQLYVTAGDEASTVKLTTNLLNAPDRLYGTATSLYFRGRNDGIEGRELWKSDGLISGTEMVIDLTPGGGQNSNVNHFQEFNNKIYFAAITTLQGSPNTGIELFLSDGTSAGTELVVDINAGTAHGDPSNLFAFNNKLFFTAQSPDYGREMFSVNTTGTLELLKDIQVGATGSSPIEMIVHNGLIYFSATDGINNNGRELWISDGFSNGTQLLKDINPATVGNRDSNPTNFTSLGTDLFFVAKDNINGFELWKTDGTSAGTAMVKDISPTGSSNPQELTVYNGKLYFTADDGVNGRELWVSDGTSNGTQIVVELIGGSSGSDISDLIVFENELYFAANDDTTGQEFWAYRDPSLSIESIEIESMSLYPNPAEDAFTLTLKKGVSISKVSIVDVQGKVIKLFHGNFDNYSINDLSAGLYFVKIESNLGKATKRLIKL